MVYDLQLFSKAELCPVCVPQSVPQWDGVRSGALRKVVKS